VTAGDGGWAEDPGARWFDRAFRRDYLQVYAHRDLESARGEVESILALGLKGRVLDLCCGWGRHAYWMVRAGCEVVGLDRSLDLLQASQELPDRGRCLAGRLVRADMAALPFRPAQFDSVVNLFSSFGYFGAEGDLCVLQEISRVLRSGGSYLLDLMNADAVCAGLVPESERVFDDLLVRERRRLEQGPLRVVKEVELEVPGTPVRTWREEVRLYSLEECRGLLARAGLPLAHAWGDHARRPLERISPRMLLLGTKPHAPPGN
jgi:SAM-dependent methyltransferase